MAPWFRQDIAIWIGLAQGKKLTDDLYRLSMKDFFKGI